MYISDNYINSKKIATENYNNYVAAKPFPIIVFDNLFEEDILNLILLHLLPLRFLMLQLNKQKKN